MWPLLHTCNKGPVLSQCKGSVHCDAFISLPPKAETLTGMWMHQLTLQRQAAPRIELAAVSGQALMDQEFCDDRSQSGLS